MYQGWGGMGPPIASGLLALSLAGSSSSSSSLSMASGMEGTDSKCPPTLQVRRGHPTVHSETKYVELIDLNEGMDFS